MYMIAAQSNQSGVYTVSIDNAAAQTIDGFISSSSAVTWNVVNLPNRPHVVFVNLTGPSPVNQNAQSASAFELGGFMFAFNLCC